MRSSNIDRRTDRGQIAISMSLDGTGRSALSPVLIRPYRAVPLGTAAFLRRLGKPILPALKGANHAAGAQHDSPGF